MLHSLLSLQKAPLEKTHYDKPPKITRIRPFRLTDRDIEILTFINEFSSWISTRRLMQAKHQNGVGKPGHLPDGVLVFPDQERVAIEVELTPKGKDRLARILKGYTANFDYQEVRYYCSSDTASRIARMTADRPFVKVHSLGEWSM